MNNIVLGLDNRIDTMTDELQRLDIKISQSLGLEPDYDRIARAEFTDHRKD
jgi:5-formaminoimidazole-4-carboxamide-1-beta-D-ribofuranosyl 5'-monophosphate synthetase